MTTLTCIPKLPDPSRHGAEFARQLYEALVSVGAAYIPVFQPSESIELLATLKSFFALNTIQKHVLTQHVSSPWQGVFIPLGGEHLSDEQNDYKEVLDLNLENGTYAQWINRRKVQQGGVLQAGNDRPSTSEPYLGMETRIDSDTVTQIAVPLYRLFHRFQEQANHVLAAIETLYHQPMGSLVAQHGKNSTLRLLHYPPAPHFQVGSVRLGTHQDYSGITLLWQDSVGGLEILTPDGEWIAVDIPVGCIGVIASEVMQQWSGDTLHATPHRVRVNHAQQLQKSRYSIAFFCETNHDCIVYPGALLHDRVGDAEHSAKQGNASIQPGTQPPIVIHSFLSEKYAQIMTPARV